MLRLTGNEKAVLGGVTSALFTIIVQLADKPQLTAHDIVVALAAYAATHLTVWVSTNTPKPAVYSNPIGPALAPGEVVPSVVVTPEIPAL